MAQVGSRDDLPVLGERPQLGDESLEELEPPCVQDVTTPPVIALDGHEFHLDQNLEVLPHRLLAHVEVLANCVDGAWLVPHESEDCLASADSERTQNCPTTAVGDSIATVHFAAIGF